MVRGVKVFPLVVALADSVTRIAVFLTILHCLALGLTVFRIHYRHRTRRLWWDDYFAAGAGILDFAGLLVLWMDYAGPGIAICYI